MAENVLEKIIKNKSEKIVNLKKTITIDSLNELIDTNKHLILSAAHPSPFSAHKGFFGCKHFSKTNSYLKSSNQELIDWSLPL